MITQLTENLYHVISDLNIMIKCGFHTDLTQHYKALEASIREYKETPEALYRELFEPWCREDFSRFCRLVNIIENKNEDWQENSIKILPDFAVIFNELCFIYNEIAMRQPEFVKSIEVDTTEGVKMPEELNTDRARKYFARAIECGYMKPIANGYKWEFGGKRGALARLGYFLYKTLCPTNTEQIPQQAVNRLFGVKRIDSAIAQVHNAKKPQKWRAEIDKLFVD